MDSARSRTVEDLVHASLISGDNVTVIIVSFQLCDLLNYFENRIR